mmetsp:Transcript_42334/g.128195  ORF Transcript_42334/g.128195 Transcript_42334/m.128195 type:complete len:211 (-) Transcript_42334:177-809(-)
MKMASAMRSALYCGDWTPPKSTSKLSTSGAKKNLQQPGTFFSSLPTSSPLLASLTGKLTVAHGPQGSGQQRPHWQQPPTALRAVLSSGPLRAKVRSQQAHGSLMDPILSPEVASMTSTTGLLKQRQVHEKSRFSSNAFWFWPPCVSAMVTFHGAQSGAHCLTCRMQQLVCSTAKKTSLPLSSWMLYLFAISTSCPMMAVTASRMLTFSLT